MKNQHKFFIVSLIFLCLLISLSAVSADDLDTIADGEVSGDVDVVTTSPWGPTSGELSYEIPENVKDVDYAGLYVNVYSGSAQPTYAAESNISMTSNGETEQIASERLVSTEGSTDGTVYTINDHTTKCYSDYHMIYNITDKVQGKTGTITFNVNNAAIDGYSFDGRIKLIGLVFAYNDGDNDKVSYWVNSGQSWTNSLDNPTKATFDVGNTENIVAEATIDNVALSSTDGLYSFNAIELDEKMSSETGSMYKYNKFNVLDKLVNGTNTLTYARSGSFKNVLSVLKISYNILSVSPSLSTEYTSGGGACYAGTNNTLKLNLANNGNVNTFYAVDFYVDGVKVGSYEIEVPVGGSDVLYMTDDTIRPVTEATVNGADNAKVNYTAIISDKDTGVVLNETSVLVPVLYNGNLGKDLAYPAESITSFNNITVNGGVIIDTKEAATYLAAGNLSKTDIWTLDLAADADIINAYLYVAYNWDKTDGNIPVWTTTFNNAAISPVASYRDQSNLGTYGKYGYGLIVYDVSDLVNKNGDNTFVLEKISGMTAVYPSTFVVFYNVTDSDTITTVYMYNGADLLANSNNLAGRTAAANSVLDIDPVDNLLLAKLHVFAASAQPGEGNLIVNGVAFDNVWTGTSNTTDEYVLDVTDFIASSNSVSFVATGSTILALQQFVVVKNAVPSVSAKVANEYTSGGGACYAGTNNTLQVNLTNDGLIDATYTVDLYVNGEKLDSTEVSVAVGEKTVVYLTDDTIRPITAATVNGAENAEKVNYTVVISDKLSGAVLSESTLTPTVLYNGNLGKDFAYPAESITPFNSISINGDIIIDTKADSTYLAAGNLSKTDVWTIELPAGATVVNGYVYVAYNWDKTDGTIPVWTTTFNNVAISPLASYRDQSNLGTYGKYGYGLVVYDVSDLIQNGENTFVLEKISGMTAVYPSTLVVLYNVSGSEAIKNVYMFNGADLLANSNNLAGRTAAANSVLDIDLPMFIENAKLHIFAASAQSGEGNLIVNGQTFTNVWSGSSNSTNEYIVDLTDSIASSNSVSFVATGSTILALQQFIVVDLATPTASDLQKLIDETPADGVLNLSNLNFADVSNVNITKDITLVGDNLVINTLGDGNPVFNIASDVEKVSISGVEFVANNGDVLVKAIAKNGTDDLSIVNPAIELTNNTVTPANENVVTKSITFFELEAERAVLAPSNPITIQDNNIADGVKTFAFEVAGLNDGSGIDIPQGGSINTNGSATVKKATVISSKDITTTTVNTKLDGKNAGKNFSITLKDSTGKVLANKEVIIYFNNKAYKRTTDAKGVATLKVAMAKKGTYGVLVSFLGDKDYDASYVTAKVKVNPQKVKIKVPTKKIKSSKKTKVLTATLTNSKGKAIKGKKLTFTVNGKKYTAKTNSKGIAKVKVKLSKKKTYKVTVKFAGDNTYKKLTKKGKAVIK